MNFDKKQYITPLLLDGIGTFYFGDEGDEIVRCEDCKYSEECMQIVDIDDGTDFISNPIYYCSYGERKEDDD